MSEYVHILDWDYYSFNRLDSMSPDKCSSRRVFKSRKAAEIYEQELLACAVKIGTSIQTFIQEVPLYTKEEDDGKRAREALSTTSNSKKDGRGSDER